MCRTSSPAQRRHACVWALTLCAVLLGHAAVLWGLSRGLQTPPQRPVQTPVFARVLLPSPPPPHPAQARHHSAAPRPTHRTLPASALGKAEPGTTPSPLPATSTAAPAASSPPGAGASTPRSAPAAASAPTRPASSPASQAWPDSIRLLYALQGRYRGELHGQGRLDWIRSGDTYRVQLAGSALVDFAYTSEGRIDGAWLAPQQYTERVLLRVKQVQFDRSAGVIRFSALATTAPLQARLQDSASVFMQLAQLLRLNPAQFVTGAMIDIPLARPSGLTVWNFTIDGQEDVATGLGTLRCWHLTYHPTSGGDLGAQVWLAPALQDLPVQIRLQHDEGEYLLLTLRQALQT